MKIRATCNHEITVEVAKELGLSVQEIKLIVDSQSLFTKQTMESNSFDGVRWPYFGVFKAKPKEVQIINHLKGLNEEQKKEFKERLKAGYYQNEKTKRHQRKGSPPRTEDQASGEASGAKREDVHPWGSEV